MNERDTEQRTAGEILREKKRRRRWLAVLLVLAVAVSAGTLWAFHYQGIAATYQKQVLDCHAVSGMVSHVHNDDCYRNGELVCPLEEIEPHQHTEACYTSVLFCGLEESEGHQHTEACFIPQMELGCGLEETDGDETHPAHHHTAECYAPVRELICGLEETPGDETHPAHWHTDECYQDVKLLICGMEEGEGAHHHTDACYEQVLTCEKPALPVHVHGPECFRMEEMTEEEIAAMNLADETPENIETTGTGPVEETVLAENYPEQHFEGEAAGLLVSVNAPAGAFPQGTEMVVSPIEDEEVLNAATAEVQGEVVLVQGVDISFFDAEGNEIEPLVPIQVEMVPSQESAGIIPDITEVSNEQTLVHVDSELAATVMEQEDNTTPEVRFESDSFSAYIIVYTKIETSVLASDGNNYKITVTAPDDAPFPENAKLWTSEIEVGANAYGVTYLEYLTKTEYALGWESGSTTYVRLFDIFVGDEFGNKLSLTTPVDVKIELLDKEAGTESSVVHFGTKTEVLASATEGQTVSFETSSLTVYAVAESTITQYVLASDGQNYKISLTYGPDAGIPDGAELVAKEVVSGETADGSMSYEDYAAKAERTLDENVRLTFARFFDITIMVDGAEFQPLAPVEVKIELAEAQDQASEDVKALHFYDDGGIRTIPTSVEEQTVSFNADGFSVYGIIGTETIEATYITADGETYRITVNYTPEAEIPAGSKLVVSEILRGTAEYEQYRAQTQEALGTSDIPVAAAPSGEDSGMEEDGISEETGDTADSVTYPITGIAQSQLTFFRLFDISIMHGEEEIEPKVPVEVVITYVEPVNTDGSSLDVVHFTETGVEVLEEVTLSEDGTEIKYQAESFSVYGTAQSAVGAGDYIIYRASNDNQALNYNGANLGRSAVTIGGGRVSSTNDNVVWTFTSVTGGYRLSYVSNGITYYLRATANNSIGTTTQQNEASTWSYSNNHLTTTYNGSTRYLRYNDGFSLTGNSGSGRTIYLAKIQEPATITIHYVNESGEEVLASHELEDSTSTGTIKDLVPAVAGYTYHNTYLTSTSGTQIVPELRGAGGGTWEYQVYGQQNYTQFSGDTDIYVVYGGAYGTGGGSGSGGGGDDLEIDTPAAGKHVTPNTDGTFTLSLSITGEKDTGDDHRGANIILVLDTSNSMNNNVGTGGTRFSNAVSAAQNVSSNLLGLNTEDYPNLVEMCLVEFNYDVATSGWYTEAGTANAQGTYPSGTFNRLIADASRNSGTNWEEALQAAIAAANGHNDGDATYIIFLTDGNPSANSANSSTNRYDTEASASNYRTNKNYMTATDEARQIIQNGWNFYTIGMYGNVDVLRYLTNFAYYGESVNQTENIDTQGTYYFPAAQTSTLIAALDDIAEVISNSLAVAGVDFQDGIAQDVTHTALTTNVGSGTLGGVTYRKNGGETASYTVTTDASGNATFNFSGNTVAGTLTTISYKKIVDVEGGNPTEQDATAQVYAATYNGKTYYMPIATVSEAGDFEWDVSPLGTLEDNATYTVSFKVWPDQDAYDYVTNLNNGIEGYTWDSSSEQEVLTPSGSVAYYTNGVSRYPNIVKYPNGTFAAMSNTYQTVDYYVAKTEEVDGVTTTTYEKGDPIALDIPDPMVLTGSNFTVTKSWDDSLDQSQLAKLIADAVAQGQTYSITLNLTEDGVFYKSYTFEPVWNAETEKYDWPPQTINIAPALLTSTNPGGTYKTVTINGTTYYVLNEGHEYVLEETDLDSHFEFVTETYHPAIVNGVLMNVDFELNDKYEIVDGSTAEIVGTVPLTTFAGVNTLKGGINIYKTVVDEAGTPVDDDSTFKVQVALDHINQAGTQIWFDTYEVDSTGAIVKPTADELNYWLDTSTGGHGATQAEAGPGPYYELVKIIDAEKGIYKNASGVLYGVNGKVIKYDDETNYIGTGGYGNVSGYTNVLDIQDNWMIRIVNVLAETTYEVTETQTNGMQPSYAYWHDNASSEEPIVIGNAASNIRVTNKIINRKVIVYKTDTSKTPVPLSGAVFTINGKTLTSGTNGYTAVIELPISDTAYDLTETNPPAGYNALTNPVKVNVSSSGVTYIQSDYDGGNPQTAEQDANGNYVIHVRDNPGVELPQTGGPGAELFEAIGGIMMALAFAVMVIRKRKMA